MQPIKMLALSACVGAVLAGCGGGGSSAPTTSPATASGTFIDSAVAGLHYTSGGQSGSTGTDGSFTCEVGQPVTFTLGNLVLPTVTCAAGTNVVSPMTVFGTPDLTDPKVVNLARLLQTLDTDGDPNTDGITIGASVYTETAGTDISGVLFDDANFDANTALSDFIAAAKGATTPLVSGADATAHMQSQTLAGTWLLVQGDMNNLLTFFADGSYMQALGRPVSSGLSGMERGTYTWNSTTGAFTASASADTLGDGGLAPGDGAVMIQIAGNTMTFNDPVDGPLLLTRLVPDTNPIVGSWLLVEGDMHNLITFFADGSYMQAVSRPVSSGPGMERGTYTWDQATGAFTASASTVDTLGDGGLSPGDGAATIQIAGNTMTFNDPVDGPILLTRVVP